MDEKNAGFEAKSVTSQEFEEKHVPTLNTIAELILSHPDIPEDVEQSNLLGALSLLTTELRNGLNNRVGEIVKLQEDLSKKNKQVQKLQETNQQLFLKVGAYKDPAQSQNQEEKPKKTFEEIKAMIDKM